MRYLTVVVVFMAAAYFQIANVMTLFGGVMGLKISAYLQPVFHKLLEKFKKSK